jgi:hypothetical protein
VSAAPGWYPDPQWMGRERYWDGQTWTDQSRLWEGPRKPAPSMPTPALPSGASQTAQVVRPQKAPPRPKPTGGAATALLVLLTVLIGEAALVAPFIVGFYFRWPLWIAPLLPLAVWWGIAIAHRAAPNACVSGLVTTESARSLPPAQLEAVLAHERGHRTGWQRVPTFAITRLTWPSRLLWWTLKTLWTPIAPMWKRAVEWHRPIGFLLVFLLAATATVVTIVLAIPAAVTYAVRLLTRPLTELTEFQADTHAARMGLGTELLAAIEHQIESSKDLPLPLVRRAQRLRRHLTETR